MWLGVLYEEWTCLFGFSTWDGATWFVMPRCALDLMFGNQRLCWKTDNGDSSGKNWMVVNKRGRFVDRDPGIVRK